MSISKIATNLEVVISSMMANNTYLLYNKNEVVVIDPSFAGQELIEHLCKDKKVVAVLLTHAHFDHTFDTFLVAKTYDCPVYMLNKEKETYQMYDCSNWFEQEIHKFDKYLNFVPEGELKIGNFKFTLVHTPGHTAGGMTILYDNYAFVGDTLFYDSYGRTDLYNSSQKQMKESLKKLYKLLQDKNIVLPGHGNWGPFKQIKDTNSIVLQLIK